MILISRSLAFLIAFSFGALAFSDTLQPPPIVAFYTPQISLADAVKDMKASGQDKKLADVIYNMVKNTKLVNISEDQLSQMLDGIAKDGALNSPSARFPMVPLALFAGFDRQRSEQLAQLEKSSAPAAVQTDINTDLATLSSSATLCTHTAVPLKTITDSIQEGSFEDPAQSNCEKEKGLALTRVLNRLARGEFANQPLLFLRERVASASDMIKVLMDTGHTVWLSDGRTYANFLDFVYKGKAVVMPFWMDTGYTFSNGDKIVLPTGHSEWIWQISGPVVTTTVRFYQGEDGIGFDDNIYLRPQWTGYNTHVRAVSTTTEGPEIIRQATLAAEGLMRRIHEETLPNAGEAMSLWSDGYGYTGVCDDTTAMIEAAIFKTISVYPLLRHPDLLAAGLPKMNDGLDDMFSDADKLMVSDIPTAGAAVDPGARKAALERMLDMQPAGLTEVGSLLDFNLPLRADIERLRKELQ